MNSNIFSLDDYDSIGFDLDCTIAEYNYRNILKLVYDLMVEYVIKEKNYEGEFLTEPLEESEFFLQKGLFMDLQRGNVLKINHEGAIIMATHGTKALSNEQILGLYGPNKTVSVFQDFVEDPFSMINTPHEKLFRTTLDCFDLPCILLFARMVDQLDAKNGGMAHEYNIWPDILSGLYHLYSRNHFATGESKFFSELRNNPWLYYEKWSSKKLNWLKELKSKKFVFLLTGSFIDFASLTASYCLGENWKDYFDVIVCYARKPFFFCAGHQFFRVEDTREKEFLTGEHLQVNKIYSQGNWQELKALISKHTNVEEPKCLYIGDNIIQDVYAPSHCHSCDSVAVSSELSLESELSKYWGSYFKGENNRSSFWNNLIRSHAQICISGLDIFVERPLGFQYHCLKSKSTDALNELNGFYAN